MVNAGIQVRNDGDRFRADCPKLGLSAWAKTPEGALDGVRRQMVSVLKAILSELEYVERDEVLEVLESASDQFTDEVEYVAEAKADELVRLRGRGVSGKR